MKPTLWGLLTGFSLILFGGVIGRLIAEPQIYNDYRFAPVPAHTCLVYNYSTCGMYRDKFGDFIEVNRSGKLRKFNGSAENGPIYSRAYPVLTDAQVHVVQNQRAVLRKAAEFKASAIGTGWGIVVWLSAATGLWLLAQITRLHQRVRPKVSTIALRAGQSTQVYRQSFSEKLAEKAAMRALRADVEKSELLARHAVANAKLGRANPDATQHEVELRNVFRNSILRQNYPNKKAATHHLRGGFLNFQSPRKT